MTGISEPQADCGRERAVVPIRPTAPVVSLPNVRCALCGEPLPRRADRFAMISPLGVDAGRTVTVCRTCRRAAVGDGYLPVSTSI